MSSPFQEQMIRKGSVLIDQGRYQEATKIFKDGLANDPTNSHLLYLLALTQYHTDGQQKQALQTIDQALKFAPEEPACYQLKALIFAHLDKPKLALEQIEKALDLDAEYAQAHATKGYIYVLMEKWSDAEKYAQDALAIDPDNKFAGSILANALRMQNKLNESVHLASDMLAKDPEDSVSHCNAGWVYLNRKEYQKAQEHFKEALRLDPNLEPARSGMLEAFKARSLIYRLYLQYGLFMAQQTKAMRTGIIIGIYLLFRLVSKNFSSIFHGPLVMVGYGVIVLFYLFFFWSWLSGGIGNLLVLKDKMARHVLRKEEKLDAVFVGGGFLLGIFLFVLAIAQPIKSVPLAVFSIGLILSTIPFAVTFRNPRKAGRIFYGAIAGYLVFVGFLLAIGAHIYGKDIPFLMKTLSGIGVMLFIASTWLGTFGFLRK
jgi:Tfp pilus assembly protein PilF